MTDFHKKLRKLSFMFFSEIQIIKDVCKKQKQANFEILRLHHFKFRIPTA